VFAIFFQGGTGFQPVSVLFDRQDACPTAIKIPGHESGAKQRGLCAKKLGKRANDVNSAKRSRPKKRDLFGRGGSRLQPSQILKAQAVSTYIDAIRWLPRSY
jgi:hypothetical protein